MALKVAICGMFLWEAQVEHPLRLLFGLFTKRLYLYGVKTRLPRGLASSASVGVATNVWRNYCLDGPPWSTTC